MWCMCCGHRCLPSGHQTTKGLGDMHLGNMSDELEIQKSTTQRTRTTISTRPSSVTSTGKGWSPGAMPMAIASDFPRTSGDRSSVKVFVIGRATIASIPNVSIPITGSKARHGKLIAFTFSCSYVAGTSIAAWCPFFRAFDRLNAIEGIAADANQHFGSIGNRQDIIFISKISFQRGLTTSKGRKDE